MVDITGMSKEEVLRALRETRAAKEFVKPVLKPHEKEVMHRERLGQQADQPRRIEKPPSPPVMAAGACPVCEARRVAHAKRQKTYLERKLAKANPKS
jgi:hypothetical protein